VRVGHNEFIRTKSYMRTESNHGTRLRRFLTLGSEAGTYCVPERASTVENAPATIECLKTDGLRVVRTIVEISARGGAPRNNPALFTLALAASPNFADAETMQAALRALPEVARTGTDLCNFAGFVENLRGWGRGLRSAVADWYLRKPAAELAQQMLTHQHRNGWSHRDLLRLSHPKAATASHNALFQWAVDGELGHLASREILSGDLRQVHAFELAKKSASEDEIVNLIEENRLTHEMIPSEWKNSARVWEALLPSMPYAELLGQLGTLTAVGLLQPQSPATALVVARLIDRKRIANSRIHPIALADAQLAYRQKPAAVESVIDALKEAFHLAIENVELTGKRIQLVVEAVTRTTIADALAMIWRRAGLSTGAVDALVIITDNRLSAEGLERYRRSIGVTTQLVVIAMDAGECVADPCDPLQLNVVGFDATVPEVVAEFIKQPVAYSVTEPRP
jgi:60 kDa SS-A/Ro ribonucleoprotein